MAVAALLVAATGRMAASSPRPASPSTRATSRVVRITQFAFDPAETHAAPGDTIVWDNGDILPHTTAADSGTWSSGSLAVGARFIYVVGDTGRFAYHCAAHPTMRGTLVVK